MHVYVLMSKLKMGPKKKKRNWLAAYSTGFGFLIVTLIVYLEERKAVGEKDSEEFFRTVLSHLTTFNISPVCLGALCGHPTSNGTNW